MIVKILFELFTYISMDSRLRGNDIVVASASFVIPAQAGIHADIGNTVHMSSIYPVLPCTILRTVF